jgi:hypothetical protein
MAAGWPRDEDEDVERPSKFMDVVTTMTPRSRSRYPA